MKKFFLKIFFEVIILTIIFLTIYVTGQQILRIGANDPQIQMAEDAATALANSASPADFMPASRQPFDMSQSLAPFTMIFDSSGLLLESSANLSGKIIVPPVGTFDYAKVHGDDRFTWQPQVDERFAVVLKYYAGAHPGFVLAGRSLREVETREDNLLLLVGLAWFLCIFILVVKNFCNIIK
jgi:hypothetical protein